MTDRLRFNNQMHYRPVDRCFNMEFGYWDDNFQAWSIFAKNGIRNNTDADVFFNFDIIRGAGGNIWMDPPFEYQVIEDTPTRKVVRNGDGLIAEVPNDGHSTIPHFLKSSIETPDDWKRAKASVSASTPPRAGSMWPSSSVRIRPRAIIRWV
jgi:hypothetical protein